MLQKRAQSVAKFQVHLHIKENKLYELVQRRILALVTVGRKDATMLLVQHMGKFSIKRVMNQLSDDPTLQLLYLGTLLKHNLEHYDQSEYRVWQDKHVELLVVGHLPCRAVERRHVRRPVVDPRAGRRVPSAVSLPAADGATRRGSVRWSVGRSIPVVVARLLWRGCCGAAVVAVGRSGLLLLLWPVVVAVGRSGRADERVSGRRQRRRRRRRVEIVGDALAPPPTRLVLGLVG